MPYDAQFERLSPFSLFDLKGPSSEIRAWCKTLPAFPKSPNTLTRQSEAELCHTGQNRWILRAPLVDEKKWLKALKPETSPPEISIVRISDTLTFFRITGSMADQVVSIGCPFDLHESVFGPDAVSYTEFFGVKALILRCDGGFDCGVEQSFGDMIEDYLTRALA